MHFTLHTGWESTSMQAFERLLEKEPNAAGIRFKEYNSTIPLFRAIESCSLGMVEFVYDLYPNCEDSRDEHVNSPFHWACCTSSLAIVQFVITKNLCSLIDRNNNDLDPVRILVDPSDGDTSIAEFLLAYLESIDATKNDGERQFGVNLLASYIKAEASKDNNTSRKRRRTSLGYPLYPPRCDFQSQALSHPNNL